VGACAGGACAGVERKEVRKAFFSEEKAEARPAKAKDFYFSAASCLVARAGIVPQHQE
jgi:hypothetical protein